MNQYLYGVLVNMIVVAKVFYRFLVYLWFRVPVYATKLIMLAGAIVFLFAAFLVYPQVGVGYEGSPGGAGSSDYEVATVAGKLH